MVKSGLIILKFIVIAELTGNNHSLIGSIAPDIEILEWEFVELRLSCLQTFRVKTAVQHMKMRS
jgi:hypothetical protein